MIELLIAQDYTTSSERLCNSSATRRWITRLRLTTMYSAPAMIANTTNYKRISIASITIRLNKQKKIYEINSSVSKLLK